jgi:DHA2 family multidrug resistance protein
VKANLPTSIDLRSVPEAFLRSLEHRVDLQVFVMSFTQMAWVLLLIFLLALIPLASLKPQKGLKAAADAH